MVVNQVKSNFWKHGSLGLVEDYVVTRVPPEASTKALKNWSNLSFCVFSFPVTCVVVEVLWRCGEFEPVNTNQSWCEPHGLFEYRCWPCASLHDHNFPPSNANTSSMIMHHVPKGRVFMNIPQIWIQWNEIRSMKGHLKNLQEPCDAIMSTWPRILAMKIWGCSESKGRSYLVLVQCSVSVHTWTIELNRCVDTT